MESIRQITEPLLERLEVYLPTAFVGLIVLVLGWVFAGIMGFIASKFVQLFRLDQRVQKTTGDHYDVARIVSKLVYYIVLICVFLLVLDILGVQGALTPLWGMLEEFLGMLPNIVAALVLGFVGYLLARIASSGIGLLCRGFDPLSAKIGLGTHFSLSKLISQVAFILIFVPILIAALNALQISAISEPAIMMLEVFFRAIPQILFGALILFVAYFLGRFMSVNVVMILQNMNADSIPEKIGLKGLFGKKVSLSKLCGTVIFFFVMLAASIATAEQLGLHLVSRMIFKLTAFLVQVALGLVTLAIGNYIANLAYKFFKRSAPNSILPSMVRIVILGLVLAMGLRAMGIANDIVNLAFGLSRGACAVAVALSFGLGGREAAGKQMEYWLQKLRGNGKKDS